MLRSIVLSFVRGQLVKSHVYDGGEKTNDGSRMQFISAASHPISHGAYRAAPSRSLAVKPLSMRAVLQRVKSAKIEVDGNIVSNIGPGLLCLIGLKRTDTMLDAEFICRKILGTNFWPLVDGVPWKRNVKAMGYEILMVSQFTLYGRLKGRRPDFSQAMPSNEARTMYAEIVDLMKKSYHAYRIKDGVFGAMMNVSLENDGPVTLVVDSTKQRKHAAPNHSDSEDEIDDEMIEAIEKQ